MNSDPYDSAIWRTFNMLDADEAAIFDEAMRYDPVLQSAYLEMIRLAAAIAATTVTPINPRKGQLEHLQARLNLNPAKHTTHLWLALAGWAAAAVLVILLTLDRTGIILYHPSQNTAISPPSSVPAIPTSVPANPATPDKINPSTKPTDHSQDPALALKTPDEKSTTKVETKRLIQEIAVLRENLEQFQQRDRALFQEIPGMALPLVMQMNPPGISTEDSPALAKNDEHSPITAMLGDALRAMTGATVETSDSPETDPSAQSTTNPELPALPSAIPIYDAARDSGTLVINNLPATQENEVYNLWVTTAAGEHPIYVGSLPEGSASSADSFDFSLGSTMIMPSGFILTRDPLNAPASPTEKNTVLQGPPR